MKRVLLATGLLAVLVSATAVSAGPLYVGASLGSATLRNISTEKEDSLSSKYATTATTTNGRSRQYEVFAGWVTPWWGTAVEVSAMRGLKATKHTDVKASATYEGYTVSGQVVGVDQQATVDAYGVSVLKYVKGPWSLDPFLRVGVARFNGQLNDDVPVGGGYSIHYQKNQSMTSAFAGLGVEYRGRSNWFGRLEYRKYGRDLSQVLGSIGYRF
ncbi:MAG: outer membrane beta-barrel protein [Minisyncoccia bacterium]